MLSETFELVYTARMTAKSSHFNLKSDGFYSQSTSILGKFERVRISPVHAHACHMRFIYKAKIRPNTTTNSDVSIFRFETKSVDALHA